MIVAETPRSPAREVEIRAHPNHASVEIGQRRHPRDVASLFSQLGAAARLHLLECIMTIADFGSPIDTSDGTLDDLQGASASSLFDGGVGPPPPFQTGVSDIQAQFSTAVQDTQGAAPIDPPVSDTSITGLPPLAQQFTEFASAPLAQATLAEAREPAAVPPLGPLALPAPAFDVALRRGKAEPFLGLTAKQNPPARSGPVGEPLPRVIGELFSTPPIPIRGLRSIDRATFLKAELIKRTYIGPVRQLAVQSAVGSNDVDELRRAAGSTLIDRNRLEELKKINTVSGGLGASPARRQTFPDAVSKAAIQLVNEGRIPRMSAFQRRAEAANNPRVLRRVISNLATPDPTVERLVNNIQRAERALRVAKPLSKTLDVLMVLDAGLVAKNAFDKAQQGNIPGGLTDVAKLFGGIAGAAAAGAGAAEVASVLSLGPVGLLVLAAAAGVANATVGEALGEQAGRSLFGPSAQDRKAPNAKRGGPTVAAAAR
jgi:hypothetical protein